MRAEIRHTCKIVIVIVLVVAAILLLWEYYPRTAFGSTGTVGASSNTACLIVVNRAQTTWRYSTRAGVRPGEIVRKWIPFGLTAVKGNCTPATTRQQP